MSSTTCSTLRDIDTCLRQFAERHPNQLALADSHQQLTWGELDQQLNRVAHALMGLGLKPNQRIAILGRNSINYALLFLGGLRAGICITPLSTLASSDALVGMINDSGARLLFVSPGYWSMIEPHRHQLTLCLSNRESDQGHCLQSDGLYYLESPHGSGSAPETAVTEKRQCLADLIKLGSCDPVDLPISLDWGFNLIYSSGTTGLPKGILQSRRYRAHERQVIASLGMDESSRALVSTPLYSNTTLFMFLATMGHGGTAYLMEKFSTAEFLKLSEEKAITHAVLVPVQYERLLNDPQFDQADLSSYQCKCSTSAPLRQSTKQALLERWPQGGLAEFYGMTEGGVYCTLIAHEHPDKLDTVGQPAEDCDLRIIDEQGRELPQGNKGEIVGYSPRTMDEYHNRPDATEEASWYDDSGRRFQRSGDIGWLDNEGFLHLLDRKKDMIISGGFNVYATDLEEVLLSHPQVADAAVIAAPSEQWGETPLAFVVLAPGVNLDVEELRQWANGQLGKAQRISEVRVIDALPRSPIGKVLKRELRDGL